MASEQSHCDEDDTEVLQFNLTNPDQLTKQLDAARLDEDETDSLLKEALRINAQLKEALRLQQLEELSEDETGSSRTSNLNGTAAPPAPRNPKQSILPPIVHSDRISDVSRRYMQRDPKKNSLRGAQRAGSAPKHRNTPPERKVKKPAWDDRFSFS